MSVSPSVRLEIDHAIEKIEKENDVVVLFASEAGSRSWGLAAEASDFDVKLVYVHSVEWYLSVEETRRDVIEVSMNNGAFDIHGWELKKTLRMIRDSNCSIFEWLRSPIIYRSDPAFFDDAMSLARKYGSRKAMSFHLMNKAKRHHKDHFSGNETADVDLKKYFFVVQPLGSVLWLKVHESKDPFPPLDLEQLLKELSLDNEVLESLLTLIRAKRTRALGKGPRIPVIDAWITKYMAECDIYSRDEAPMQQFLSDPEFRKEHPFITPTEIATMANKEFNQLMYKLSIQRRLSK